MVRIKTEKVNIFRNLTAIHNRSDAIWACIAYHNGTFADIEASVLPPRALSGQVRCAHSPQRHRALLEMSGLTYRLACATVPLLRECLR